MIKQLYLKFKRRLRDKRNTYEFVLEPHEVVVLRRYVRETDNPLVPDTRALLQGMLDQQIEFVLECLAESDLVVDKLYPEVCGNEKGLG